ncbi:hypothetical protein H9Y04_21845 [Streptomyces sp. TRM66268-LWL]|uniref:Uncharacterized protein n=1 Tax=Streptomyces polyasparticus TaxID=2767826 RepID=A0ABR7SLI5_9ACTN|nr:hypothetical protein [Streptomyces polyasparticus]MBC9715198.1 hypothetical protein [Streptomyces polyasparticus]
MAKNTSSTTVTPDTAWLARGRHLGPDPELDVRRNLIALKAAGVLEDFLELEPAEAARSTVLYPRDAAADPGPSARRVFEARWRIADGVTVRAQLTTYDRESRRQQPDSVVWILAAEAEQRWHPDWPSPATMFWPDSDRVEWNHDMVPDVRIGTVNYLPADDDELRARLKDCAKQSWHLHFVVHEAMTPDGRGRQPLTSFLPPSLRHQVIEHRAIPQQAQIADFALRKERGVRLPRGGAVVLPSAEPAAAYDAEHFTLHTVFLDGSRPTELIERLAELAALPRPLAPEAEAALTRLRQGWHLLTPEEELAHAQRMAHHYAQALEAMTQSRDRYQEAAEALKAALAEATDGQGPALASPIVPAKPDSSPLSAFTKAIGRFRGPGK